MQIRKLAGTLLGRDAYDRWGNGSAEEKAANRAAMAREDRAFAELCKNLTARVVALRASEPQAVS